ncbi:hydrogenase formation protein HypD [bacterium]|nr:hydrogenase formation protein HypD [bacterium]
MMDQDAFREPAAAQSISNAIAKEAQGRPMVFMEVCGTHTMAIARHGIAALLPENIRLISGPGCPVCVTPNSFIDRAVALARLPDTVIATFGDMMKVPGSSSSLDREHALGRDIRVVASTLEALKLARKSPGKQVIFLGVGFETTAPTVAVSLMEAQKSGVGNYSVLCGHKRMPPPMEALSSGEVRIDGYLCPGHVSAIIGSEAYRFIPERFRIGCVVSGFEPLDILQSILMLVRQVRSGRCSVEVEYARVVRPAGNEKALGILSAAFETCDSEWRGLGNIRGSGFKIRKTLAAHDANRFQVRVEPPREAEGCLCGKVLKGLVQPTECRHFGKSCTPDFPVGPCMVSTEGTCAAYYKYHLK